MTRNSSPRPHSAGNNRRLGPWRTAFQWICTLLILTVPFLRVDGDSVLRLDFSTLSLHLGGSVLPIEALWLFLLFTLLLVLLFLLVTLAFGRAWCGWACPQTTLVDLVEWFARLIGVKVSAGRLTAAPWQSALLQLFSLSLALLVGANLVWYFIAPREFFSGLITGTLHWAALVTVAAVSATVYLDLALLRRVFCKEFCPYGRFQTTLVDAGTLVLRYHPDEAPRCIRCGACVKACPTGIDIRRGDQIECINCGRCLDACREVMAQRGQPGIIRYTFGLEGLGFRALFNLRIALVAATFVVVAGVLAMAGGQRAPVSLKVARNAALLPSPVGAMQAVNFFTLYLVNRETKPQTLTLTVDGEGVPVNLRGPAQPLILTPGEKRRVDVGLLTDRSVLPRTVVLRVQAQDGRRLAAEDLQLIAPSAAGAAR